MSRGIQVKYPLLLSYFDETCYFLTDFRKNAQILNFPSSGSRGDPYGRTDMTKLIVAFRKFANAPKNCPFCPQIILK